MGGSLQEVYACERYLSSPDLVGLFIDPSPSDTIAFARKCSWAPFERTAVCDADGRLMRF
jgi:hypothetical protein